MADVLKTEGLVIAATDGAGNVYPFACAQSSTITINRELLELTPKTNSYFRDYTYGKNTFTVSGTGLVKLDQAYMNDIVFFDPFITNNSDAKFLCYLDMIDAQNNYKIYKFYVWIQELTLESSYGSIPSYSFTLQGSGDITPIGSYVDSYTVASGKITGRDTDDYKLVAIGYGGKWYFNYSVSEPSAGVFEITMGSSLNGTVVKAAYIAI